MVAGAAGYDLVEAFAPQVEHLAEQGGRVLEVGVHEGDVIPGGLAQTGEQSGLLAEVPRQGQVADARVTEGEGAQQGQGAVGGPVVDEHHLVRLPEFAEPRVEFVVERLEHLLLVEAGHHD